LRSSGSDLLIVAREVMTILRTMKTTTNLLVADDHPVVPAGLAQDLQSQSFAIFAQAEGVEAMLTSAAETPSLDIMVTDYCFGGEADGLRMLERLRRLSTSSSRTAPESQIGPRATINAHASVSGPCAESATLIARRPSSCASGRSASSFAPKRHLLLASLYRKHLAARFSAWREFTEVAQKPSAAF
jgi:CheY-like chemotaxis protein